MTEEIRELLERLVKARTDEDFSNVANYLDFGVDIDSDERTLLQALIGRVWIGGTRK